MGAPDIRFYHLTRRALAPALAALLAKVLASGRRAVVRAAPGADLAALSSALWTEAGAGSFLAHGHAGAGAEHAADQPIWLTIQQDSPAGADALFLLPGAEGGGEFALTCHLFEGGDTAALAAARSAWAAAKTSGAQPTYWQETEQGGWKKKE